MQRKIFIRNIALLTGGFLVGCNKKMYSNTEAGSLLKGYVKSRGIGVKNVVVSDGYNVVITDSNGKYEFDQHPAATAVFISTPAGYAFKNQNGIARQYRLLKEVNKNKAINFDLVPLDKNDDEHDFIIWADPQVKNEKDVEKMMTESVPDVQKWVSAAGSGALLHGITVGDIVWDNHALYGDYDKAVEKMGIPFFQCLGNHDMDYIGDDETSDDTFQQFYGPTYYSFNRGKAHYVIMDNVRYLGKDREYDGYFMQHQLDWLRKDLSYVPADSLVILCVHIPVHKGTKNSDALYALIHDRNVHIMSGHTHYHQNVINGNIYEHNHGTVCGAWWTGPICGDGTPSGYGVYKVKGTELSWHYQSTGEAAAYQHKTFVKDYDALQKQLQVNIWNYDPAWKNEYVVDGVSRGSLEQFEGFDPLAYSTMLGPDLPKSRGFAEPKKTDHLFKAMIPATAKEVQVIVTDRFGKKYSSSHQV